MPVISEMVHPRGLDFANQRKVVMLRDEGGDAEQDEWNSKRDLAVTFSQKGDAQKLQGGWRSIYLSGALVFSGNPF